MYPDSEQKSPMAAFQTLAGYFTLLSEPTRLRLLHLLCRGECSVSDAAGEMETTHANISRQLNLLYQAQLVARRKDGTQVLYRIEDWQTIELCRTVCRQIFKDIRWQQLELSQLFTSQGSRGHQPSSFEKEE